MSTAATLMSTYPFTGTPEEQARIEAAIPERAAPPRKRRKLLVCSLNVRDGKVTGGHPSIPHGALALELMGARTGAYATTFSDDPGIFSRDRLAEFDAICFNNSCGVLTEDALQRQAILDFVAGGKGFVGIHAAAATFVQWPKYDQFPAFGEMLGATENGGHPWRPDETITLKVEDPASPLNEAFAGRPLEVQDEVFQFQKPYTRDRLHVLLSIDTDTTDMSTSRRFLPERLADRDFAMSWVRKYGAGRVFYSSLGHNRDIFWNGKILAHFLAGIQFAMGDIDADATPSAKR